ncbi:MAG: GatB/YqeY domain-containing protein [Pseudomonadota bacterium]|nr:GatB/YqeY domain-containing protein [Pseudomonadota bacterium]
MSDFKTRLSDELKSAMRARQMDRIGVIRGVQAAIKQIEIDERVSLEDAQVLAVLEKQLKQRRESIAAYQAAGRQDLVDKEQFEVDVISHFLPAALTEAELDQLIQAEIAAQSASSIRDMGKVMNALRPKIAGRADPAQVSGKIKQLLS